MTNRLRVRPFYVLIISSRYRAEATVSVGTAAREVITCSL